MRNGWFPERLERTHNEDFNRSGDHAVELSEPPELIASVAHADELAALRVIERTHCPTCQAAQGQPCWPSSSEVHLERDARAAMYG